MWHALSKTLAEKTAWALAMDRGVNMVSINGGFLMPPHLTIKNPYLKGAAEMYEDGVFVTVDLNFIVDSHICIFEKVSSMADISASTMSSVATKMALSLLTYYCHPLKPVLLQNLYGFGHLRSCSKS